MISLFYGTDTIAVRQTAFKKLAELQAADTDVVAIDAESFASGMLGDAVGATSLFGGQSLYLIDTPSNKSEFATEVESCLTAMQESVNQFVVIEEALLAADKKRWAKYANEMEECKAVAGERFNTFAMADALAKKDKKTLWLLLQDAKAAGQSAEEIIGVLWWQLKSLRLAASTKNAAEAGMKDFPYNKAKRSLSTFKDGELEHLSRSLLTVYHDGHGGVVDIDLALEKWTLTL